TDVTYLRVGQPVTMYIDAFPERTFRGTVQSVSPGTGAEFSIRPPQNASGNWVKVVQRLPLRIAFASGQDLEKLRASMSAVVDIDTGRERSLASLFGSRNTARAEAKLRRLRPISARRCGGRSSPSAR